VSREQQERPERHGSKEEAIEADAIPGMWVQRTKIADQEMEMTPIPMRYSSCGPAVRITYYGTPG